MTVLTVAACANSVHSERSTITTVSNRPVATSPPTSTTTTTALPVSKVGDYPVATTSMTLSEPGGGGSTRTLYLSAWYPTGSPATSGAGGMPFPLVVFSPGYDIDVAPYDSLLASWASAGYVVAAVVYPFTDPDYGPVDENDIVNHPADLRFAITQLLAISGRSGSALSGKINPAEIGLAGHSDGGVVTLTAAHGSCCQDPRIKAAAILSGSEYAAFGGTYLAGSNVPLLVVQGSADSINVPVCSSQAYDTATSTKWYLGLDGAAHLTPYVDAGTDQQVVLHVVTDFFDGELKGQPTLSLLAGDGDVPGETTLINGPQAPAESGMCAGAPG